MERFLSWLHDCGQVHDIPVIAVNPAFTSQEASPSGRMSHVGGWCLTATTMPRRTS